MFSKIILVFFIVFIPFLFNLQALENEESNSSPPVTCTNPNIGLEELKLLLKPLTKEELNVEIDAWLKLLQKKVYSVSMTEIKIIKAPDNQKDVLLEKVNILREQRTSMIDRLRVVLDSFFIKGREIEIYEKYIEAVSGITLDKEDSFTALKTVQGWLVSKEGGLRWRTNIIKFSIDIDFVLVPGPRSCWCC